MTVAPSTAESLRVPVTGAGIVLLTLASRNSAQVSFAVDGREAAGDSPSVSTEFEERRFFIPPGAQWFEMRVQPSRFTPDVPDTALVDAIRFVPASTVSLAAALDEPALTFTTHPDRPWAPLAWANAMDGARRFVEW